MPDIPFVSRPIHESNVNAAPRALAWLSFDVRHLENSELAPCMPHRCTTAHRTVYGSNQDKR